MDKYKQKYCYGCLSTGRHLLPINKYMDSYVKLMENVFNNTNKLSDNKPSMCWECRALLRNVVTFQNRIKTAYKYISTQAKKMPHINTLSNLTSSYTDDCISIIYEENKSEFKIETEPNEIHLQNDIDVKIEESFDEKTEDIDSLKELNLDIKTEFDTKLEFSDDLELYEQDECNEDVDFYVKDEYVDQKVNMELELKKAKAKRVKDKLIESISRKYKFISNSDETFNNRESIRRVRIFERERVRWLEEDKKARNYSKMTFKCKLCITGYAKEKYYAQHVKRFHSKSSGNFECDICKKRFNHKINLKSHINEHFTKYICTICNFESYKIWKIKSHLDFSHKRAVMCLICGLKFEKRPEFYQHYKKLHTKVICDYCKKSFTKKHRLIGHIFRRHSKHRCDICKRDYSSLDALTRHNNFNHVISRTDTCYCVECDIQFDNSNRYRNHLKTSVKHKTVVGIPCPECNKVYNKRYTMNNHYKHVHLQKTDFYCQKCSRYFLNGFRLRQHTASVHDKIPHVKNKICPHCGRGFSTNRILSNHIKTHTGERPFSCDVCQSTFTQKTALVVHKRAIHKDK